MTDSLAVPTATSFRDVDVAALDQRRRELNAALALHRVLREQEMEEIQEPARLLARDLSIGAPSEKRIKENILSLRERNKANRRWVVGERKRIEKAKALLLKMEKQVVA